MILLLDHEDSFVHTLADYLRQLGAATTVLRVGDTSLEQISAIGPDGILLSPGPCSPTEAPLSIAVVQRLGPVIPILGVCLGHQIIAASWGAVVRRASAPRHGMTSPIRHDGQGVLAGLPSPLVGTRYHSLAVEERSLPPELVATAWAEDDGELMGIRHRSHPTEGVQFHPEALLTEGGMRLLGNWLGGMNGAAASRRRGER